MSTALPMTLTKTKFAEGLNNMIEEFSLIDIWRVRHFDTYGFSYSQGNNKIKSRLDYWFISEHMQYSVTNVNIKPAIKTDHCLVAFKMIINKQNKRGRGFWKFNSSYLDDMEFVPKCKDIINTTFNKLNENKNINWELIKMEIRGYCIKYAAAKAKDRRKTEESIMSELENLKNKLDNEYNEDDNVRYLNLLHEQESLNSFHTKGAIIRSRSLYIEQGEHSTKYFFNLEKRNQTVKNISSILSAEGIVTDPGQILEIEKQYYQDLYKCQNSHEDDDLDYFY